MSTSESRSTRPQRVLACTLCQQRKVKCDRTFPCANCTKAGAHCVPAALVPRQRRPRFPERELLDRLGKYEGLLQKHGIKFEPLHQLTKDPPKESDSQETSETVYDARSFWQAMAQPSEASDEESESPFHNDVSESLRLNAWDQAHESNDQLLFGPRREIDFQAAHPSQVQIFKLWQVYLENVDPLLKATHTPSLQPLIIEAASDMKNISAPLEALMFGIYCVSIVSLDSNSLFGVPKKELLRTYQFGCQQALINCGVLRSTNLDSLTAFFLYLVSLRPDSIDPRAVSPMLGVAVRIAQRMRLHNEASYAGLAPFEAEMRRRLWWALVTFDNRICELSDFKASILNPTWDCKRPLNVNDFDLRREMKSLPTSHNQLTEALFVLVRYELGDLIRHSHFHLNYTSPSLKAIAKDPQDSGLVSFENAVEERFRLCNPENPLHFMTIWMTRAAIAKARLMEYYDRHATLSTHQPDEQRDTAISYALDMLRSDTKLVTSPLTKGYLWLVHLYFPLPAYMNIAQELARRPTGKLVQQAWSVMSDNYESRFTDLDHESPIFAIFAKLTLQAWESCEMVRIKSNLPSDLPWIVRNAKQRLQKSSGTQELPVAKPGQTSGAAIGPYSDFLGQPMADVDMDQLDWAAIDWNPMSGQGW
ncbi:uncharacterized protein HMPREF1541_04232 [Cyphellophora europaea CBS 101466]|uniref:Zn(2)-C6 fungal-type domain-containing protein n=1 Tax=Cyphellophora europaea (strain CBS 101466) TaxID=1220924 RepID=W2S0P0_CYPE1|nr:uncharacterized protein HMPREF1541_04232 [Cyphellophora europaea CBS 101466]ETN42291.1 hypothetical protein HMPREF1541_04232 [Cyphellophora europaea CBS 101466]